MTRIAVALIALGSCLSPCSARADFVFYSDRAAFDAANPGLPVETFEEARVAPEAFSSFPSPLSASTADAVFSPGDILPGLTVSSSPFGPGLMLALGRDALNGASKVVGNQRTFPFDDSLHLFFTPGVHAAGADFYAALTPGDALPATLSVAVFDTSGEATGLLGSFGVRLASRTGGFFGVSSTVPIGRIVARTTGGAAVAEFADNVAFGDPVVVPEPGGLVLMGIGAVALCACKRRRA